MSGKRRVKPARRLDQSLAHSSLQPDPMSPAARRHHPRRSRTG